MMADRDSRGPISCGIDAMHILNYTSDVFVVAGEYVYHVIGVVGWENDASKGKDRII